MRDAPNVIRSLGEGINTEDRSAIGLGCQYGMTIMQTSKEAHDSFSHEMNDGCIHQVQVRKGRAHSNVCC